MKNILRAALAAALLLHGALHAQTIKLGVLSIDSGPLAPNATAINDGATLAVDFDAVRSQITHTHYGALKVKDAIVDQLRDASCS